MKYFIILTADTRINTQKSPLLQETLEKGGITPEVNLSLDISSNGKTRPRTKTPVDTTQTDPITTGSCPITRESVPVRALAKKRDKQHIALYAIGGEDGKKKPIMDKIDPVESIANGEKFRVSKSSKDNKPRIIIASGVTREDHYYFITDYPGNPGAVRKYVLRDDVQEA